MWFEEFAVGQVFVSQRRTITEADLVTFAGWSWDTNPVHTDVVGASQGRYGAPIAHGVLGLSVALGLASRLGVFEESSVALLGIDGYRFVAPVLVGDTVQCRVEVIGTRLISSGAAGVLHRRFTLTNHRDEVVQEGQISLLVAVRPT